MHRHTSHEQASPSTAGRPRRVFARCPKCRGRLLFQSDQHGCYLSCLICGFVLEERPEPQTRQIEQPLTAWWREQAG